MIFILNNATLQQKNFIVSTRLLQVSCSPFLTSFGSNSSEDSRLQSTLSYHNSPLLTVRIVQFQYPARFRQIPCTRALLAAKYVADPVEWMSPTDESILRDKMVPIDRTALYVEDTTILQSHILGKKRGSSSAPSGHPPPHQLLQPSRW